MSQENVEVVRRSVAAINERDIDGYLAGCSDDVQLSMRLAVPSGVFEGHEGISRWFTDILRTGPGFHLTIERLQAVGGERVLALMRVSGTGWASRIRAAEDLPTGNVYDLTGGKIKRIRIFVDRDQALEAAGLRE